MICYTSGAIELKRKAFLKGCGQGVKAPGIKPKMFNGC